MLGPGGKAVFIVPNRGGLWSRSDRTPFGHGRPYSAGQLEAQLRQHGFLPERHAAALYRPPSMRRFWLRAGGLLERVGRGMPSVIAGGVVMVEASKRVHQPGGQTVTDRLRRRAVVPQGVAKPV